LRIKADEYRERLQFTKPEEGDEILQLPAADADKPPAPPAPVTNPNGGGMAGMSFLNRFLTLHSTQVLPELDALEARLRREAAGALAGLTDQVRAEFEAAHSMQDLASRLQKLKLDDQAFGDAMSRGMALAHLVGQAAVLDDIVPMARHAMMSETDRENLRADQFAVPGKRKLRIDDATHIKLAWDMVDRTDGLSDEERSHARKLILAAAKHHGVDTSGWNKPA
jgi:hypothetical protein